MSTSLKERLEGDQSVALREHDEVKLRTIRSIRAAIQSEEIARRKGTEANLSDEDVLAVLAKQAKQRRDSIDQFRKAERSDLVAQEEAELTIITEYLPRQLTDAEIEEVVVGIKNELGASGMSDMGKLMGAAMKQLKGKADGKRVQGIVRRLLNG